MRRGRWYWLRRTGISLGLLLVLGYLGVNLYNADAAIVGRTGSVAFYGFAALCTAAGATFELRRLRAKRADPAGHAARDRRQSRRFFMTWGTINAAVLLLAIAAGVGGAVGRQWVVRGAGLVSDSLWDSFFRGTMLAIGGIVLVMFLRSLGLDRFAEAAARRVLPRAQPWPADSPANDRQPDQW